MGYDIQKSLENTFQKILATYERIPTKAPPPTEEEPLYGPSMTHPESKMYVATWKGKVIAESNKTVEVEGNQYFPADSVRKEFLKPISKTSTCPWKGVANYYDVVVDGAVNSDAAWYYKDPKPEAAKIKGMIAFWNGVQVSLQ